MNTLTEQSILDALAGLVDDNTHQTYVAAKAINIVQIDPDMVSLEVVLGYPAQTQFEAIRQQFIAKLVPVVGYRSLQIQVKSRIESHAAQKGVALLKGVKNIIAVASGKGGVGKSTTAANLALALTAEGAKVGLLDADIYGPSQPLMMGLEGQRPEVIADKQLKPLNHYGVATMSIGYLVDRDQAMIWRGPMVSQALQQLLHDTQWDDLDFLVIDMPPGTGDIHLTLSQKIPVTGALIVTTPQDIALLDARKGITMFQKVGIPVLGVIENMGAHICSNCGHMEAIFGEGGANTLAEEYQTEVLGTLPLDLSIRQATDAGKPSVIADPDGPIALLYKQIARKMAAKVAQKAKDFSSKFPKIVVQNN